jgi:hypothetical protein
VVYCWLQGPFASVSSKTKPFWPQPVEEIANSREEPLNTNQVNGRWSPHYVKVGSVGGREYQSNLTLPIFHRSISGYLQCLLLQPLKRPYIRESCYCLRHAASAGVFWPLHSHSPYRQAAITGNKRSFIRPYQSLSQHPPRNPSTGRVRYVLVDSCVRQTKLPPSVVLSPILSGREHHRSDVSL